MAYVSNKGTKDKPKWMVRFRDLDGKWKWKASPGRTRSEATRMAKDIEARIDQGLEAIEEQKLHPVMGPLIDLWLKTLTNRSKDDDKSRAKCHLTPKWEKKRIALCTLPAVMEWIDEQRAAEAITDATIRHNLNLLSRFFGWAIERGHASINPVRQIPMNKRPQQASKTDTTPWLDDDEMVRTLITKLRQPVDLMFYIGNRSGLRTGELAGLRVSDMGFLAEGIIRVRYSYDGPLKEDKTGSGKTKWAPAPAEAAEVLAPMLEKRKNDGAGPEDFLFANPQREGSYYRKEYIEDCWDEVARAKKEDGGFGLTLTWYQATRHSFVSRLLSRGEQLEQVSAAIGHAQVTTTRRYYDHFVRKQYADGLRAGLGIGTPGPKAKVIPMRRKNETQTD